MYAKKKADPSFRDFLQIVLDSSEIVTSSESAAEELAKSLGWPPNFAYRNVDNPAESFGARRDRNLRLRGFPPKDELCNRLEYVMSFGDVVDIRSRS
jgi:hypothetical protein